MAIPPRRAHAALALVSGINLLNFADRYVVAGVQELIKRDPAFPGGERDGTGRITDANLGYLGTVFVLVLVLASPVTGWLGDRVPRRYVVFGGVLLWSLATFASGWAPSFGMLLAARAAIGIGEAGYATVAPALLSDLFTPGWRGKAMGIFSVMVPLGAALGFGVGAAVGAAFSWRRAFFVAGAPGLALAFAALTLPEPERGSADGGAPQRAALGPVDTFLALIRNRSVVANLAGQTLVTFTVGGLSYWMPTFFVRQLGFGQAAAGTWFGVLVSLAGLLGTVAGTWAGEVVQARRSNGYFWVSGASLVAAVPFVLTLAFASSHALVLGATFGALFLVLVNGAPLYTALLNDVPAQLRASAMALNLVSVHLLGDALSPTLVGALSDATGSLSLAIAASSLPVLLGGLVLLGFRRSPVTAITTP